MAGIFSSLFGAIGVEVVGGSALDKAAELLFEKSGKEALEELQDRLKAYSGKIPPNHNLEHALRLCELTATLTLLFAYRRDHELAHGHDRTPPPRPPFIDGAISWVHTQIGLSPSLRVTQDAELISELNRRLDAILPAEKPEQVRAALNLAEQQVWDDLAAGAGHAPPPDFESWFRGTDEGKPGWSLVFLAFVREAMKERPRVKIAFDTSRLGMLVTTLRGVASKVDAIKEDTATLIAMVADVQKKLNLTLVERDDLIQKVQKAQKSLAKKHGKLKYQEKLIAGFFRTVLSKDIPADQFAATFMEVVASWQRVDVQLDALSASRNLSPRLGKLRDDALAAHRNNETDKAVEILRQIDHEEAEADERLARHEEEIKEERRLRREGRLASRSLEIDLMLAALNAAGAAAAIVRKLELKTEDPDALFDAIRAVQDEWYERGRDKGLNFDLEVSIEIARLSLLRAQNADQRGTAANDLGVALKSLGERETGTARLEEAVAAYRAALKEYTRARAPLEWAMTQNNLGAALQSLGQREAGTARLEESIAAYRAALEERTRARVPLDWAMTQMNLGNALSTLGQREAGTAQLEEAVAAYRAALEEVTRDRVPLNWAMTQNNLGNALNTLGEREAGTARLEEAVAAYRAALEEWTRDRVPLQWAATQNNLGTALNTLGAREAGTARLEEAVAAYRAALKEFTRDSVPLDWAMTQTNLGNALSMLGKREAGTARLEEAVAAFREALKEFTRERAPLDWANALGNQGVALLVLAERTGDLALAKQGLEQLETAEAVLREGGHVAWAANFEWQIPAARALVARLSGKGML